MPPTARGAIPEPPGDTVEWESAGRRANLPNGAHESLGQGRFLVQFGSAPALWRSAAGEGVVPLRLPPSAPPQLATRPARPARNTRRVSGYGPPAYLRR